MSANEFTLGFNDKTAIANRHTLGLIAMICSPMLWIGTSFYAADSVVANGYQIFASLCGVFYLAGIAASAVAMRRLRVTGTGRASAVLFAVQIVGLFLAMMFDVLEFAAPQMRGNAVFFIADMAYPLSHVLMIIVGFAVWRAKVWRGWRVVPAFLCGLALPAFFASSAIFDRENGFYVFPVLVTSGFFLLGYAAMTHKTSKDF